MKIIKIKPLSVNEAWKGKRYKTDKYKAYESSVLSLLPHRRKPEGNLKVYFTFNFSNTSSDIDNPVKLLLDIFQKKYLFDDKKVVEMNIKKKIVKKGHESINYSIEERYAPLIADISSCPDGGMVYIGDDVVGKIGSSGCFTSSEHLSLRQMEAVTEAMRNR